MRGTSPNIAEQSVGVPRFRLRAGDATLESMLRRPGHRLGIAAVVVATASLLVFGAGAWAFIDGGARVATFAIRLDSELLATAKGYELDAEMVSADKKALSAEYTLRISLALRDNPAPAQAFQNGQMFASARVDLLGAEATVLTTYELRNATVVAYRQSGDAATNAFVQELVLKSDLLTISGP